MSSLDSKTESFHLHTCPMHILSSDLVSSKLALTNVKLVFKRTTTDMSESAWGCTIKARCKHTLVVPHTDFGSEESVWCMDKDGNPCNAPGQLSRSDWAKVCGNCTQLIRRFSQCLAEISKDVKTDVCGAEGCDLQQV